MFTEVFVPEGVVEEITIAGVIDSASRQLPTVTWIQRLEITTIVSEVATWDLGKGESQVLNLALRTLDCAATVDDRAARRCGQALGITTIGTGGLLILAKRRGLISSVAPGIQALQDAGLWLSESVVNLLKQQTGD